MCKKDGETMPHLLLHCSFVRELWDMVLGLFGVHWVLPRDVVDLLACWQGRVERHRNNTIWKAIPHCLMWCIWHERNARILRGVHSLSWK